MREGGVKGKVTLRRHPLRLRFRPLALSAPPPTSTPSRTQTALPSVVTCVSPSPDDNLAITHSEPISREALKLRPYATAQFEQPYAESHSTPRRRALAGTGGGFLDGQPALAWLSSEE